MPGRTASAALGPCIRTTRVRSVDCARTRNLRAPEQGHLPSRALNWCARTGFRPPKAGLRGHRTIGLSHPSSLKRGVTRRGAAP